MNLLREIYNKLVLLENASITSINDAIDGKYQVVINYEGDPSHGIAPGKRVIEVYAYGLTMAGNPCIRAFQPYGDTASKVPNWKMFRIDRIKSWQPTYKLITSPAPKFNPDGDRGMSIVYSIADFGEEGKGEELTTPKVIGKLDNFDKISQDRQKDIDKTSEYYKTINRFNKPKPINKKPIEVDNQQINKPLNNTNIEKPEIEGVNDTTTDLYGHKELQKLKDLNRRLDNAPKMDLGNTQDDTIDHEDNIEDIYIDDSLYGDKELQKLRDLNRRLDNAPKININKFK